MTTAPPKASPENLSKLVNTSQQSGTLYLRSPVGNYIYQVVPTGLDGRIVIERCPLEKDERGEQFFVRRSATLYILSTCEDVIEGYAVDIDKNGLGLYNRSIISYIVKNKAGEPPRVEKFGVRRDISSSEAIELTNILQQIVKKKMDED